jgi:hypothetical protein
LLALRRIDATHALRSSLVEAASNQISPKSGQEQSDETPPPSSKARSEVQTCTRDLEWKPDLDVGRVLFHGNAWRQLLPAGGQLLFPGIAGLVEEATTYGKGAPGRADRDVAGETEGSFSN